MLCWSSAMLELLTTAPAAGLFNPQSFLTAVMQTTARRNGWPLDKTVILTEVTKRTPDQVRAQAQRSCHDSCRHCC